LLLRRLQPVHLYVALVSAGGLAVLGWLAAGATGGFGDPRLLWLFALFVLAGEAFPVTLARRGEAGEITFSQTFALALVLLGDTRAGAVALAGASALADVARRKPAWKLAFNAGQYTLSVAAAGATYAAFPGDRGGFGLGDLPAAALAGVAFFVANDVLVGVGLALDEGVRPLAFLRRDVGFWAWTSALLLGMAPIVVVLAERSLGFVPLLALPLLAVYLASRGTVELGVQARRTVELLAATVDRRDPYTYNHSARVGIYAATLAAHVGLPEGLIAEIGAAGTVHDLGKVAVPDEVLLSPRTFTEEERKLVQLHATVGGELLGHLDLYDRVRRLVRHHHERFDGRGYPDGLTGEAIPLGARVIAVADAFDAMTSDRPYRKALPLEVAVRELRDGAGRQFDPTLAVAFCELLEARPELAHPAVPPPPAPVPG
jgi:HD-GYP domain-containing protein (c-di-GMP phosphodiesterase class II)